MVSLDDVRRAGRRLDGVIETTPLLEFQGGPGAGRCFVKAESLQVTGAFKVRGAYNAVAALPSEARRRGIVTSSTGNHAIGVAFAAQRLGIAATVVMSASSPVVKRRRARSYGARLVLVDGDGEELRGAAEEIARARGLVPVWSYEDPDVIAGQGTIALEILRQLPPSPPPGRGLAILAPIGGGGLAAGIAVALAEAAPDASVVGVEPAVSPKTRLSIEAGEPVRSPAEQVRQTCADGLRVARLGALPFEILAHRIERVIGVEEAAIEEAVRVAADVAHLVVEPAGAASLAAVLSEPGLLRGDRDTVCILTGGNVDAVTYRRLLTRTRRRPATGAGGPSGAEAGPSDVERVTRKAPGAAR